MSNMWMVRAGENAFLIDDFKEKCVVAVGWHLGDLSNKTSQDIKNMIESKNPNKKKMQNAIAYSQMNKFVFDFKKEDHVLTYNPSSRKYSLGKIKSDYYYDTDLIKDEGYDSIRDVEWLGEISRDKLKVSTKNTLGAVSTIFNINEDAQKDILNVYNNTSEDLIDEKNDEEITILKEDIIDKSLEFIKDKVNLLDWYEMQELVAGLLRAMGYKTIVSPPGSDRGKDVIASPDGLGLEDPVILVEVKHRDSSMSSSDIRSFKGVLTEHNKGIYVSTGGFTTEAKYEAERSAIPIILMDLDKFVKFMIQYYDKFDNESRNLVPLTKIYWPL